MDQAIILAAGEGQRLRPLTASRPKVMLSIGSKPILQYVIEAVASSGIRRIVLVVGFRKEVVMDYFGSGEALGVTIEYVEQKQQLGTAHALAQAESAAADSFLVLSGDNIVRKGTIAPLMNIQPNAVLAKTQPDVSKYGVIVAHRDLVESIIEKPTSDTGNLVNTGIYSFSKAIFPFIREEVDLTSAITRMIDGGVPMHVVETRDDWLDVVYPWDILKLNALVLQNTKAQVAGKVERDVVIKGAVSIGEGTTVRSSCYLVGPLIIGKNCEIGPHACVFPSTSLGDGTVVSAFSSVRNSVLADNISIGPSSHLEDTIVGTGTRIGGHFIAHSEQSSVHVEGEVQQVAAGVVVGEHSTIAPCVVADPGTVVGNRCVIKAMKHITSPIPDGSLVI